jgi:hypothetical protein
LVANSDLFTYPDIDEVEVEEGVRDSRQHQQQQRAPEQHRPLAKKVTHSANTSVSAFCEKKCLRQFSALDITRWTVQVRVQSARTKK